MHVVLHRITKNVHSKNHYERTRYQGMHVHINTKTHTHTPLSSSLPAQRRSAAPCCAVRCRALPCCAELRLLFRIFQTTTLASRQSGREPAYPRAFFTALLWSLLFSLFYLFWAFSLYCTGYSSSTMCVYVVGEYLQEYREHSTAQSPLHRTANQVRADQSTYQNKYVPTFMRRSCCFPGA